MENAGVDAVDALYVANMLADQISYQAHLGALLAGVLGLRGIEAVRIEAADASGGMALRQAYMAIASGMVDSALVLGVEKPTDIVGPPRLTAASTSLDADFEAELGATPAAMAGMLMRRYMYEYGYEIADFAGFSENAHANGRANPLAMYRNILKPGRFATAPAVAEPVSLFDAAPDGDGAAALILTTSERARELHPTPIEIKASAVGTDYLAVHDRPDPLSLTAVEKSAKKAYQQLGIMPEEVSFLEAHDSFTILTALALEANGFAAKGEGVRLARDEVIGLGGSLPLSTFGGMKARGHAGGASGVYQVVEAVLQLRNEAGDNQVEGAHTAMTQNIGGIGATAVTHILRALI
jgi:acetyl-CoA C-acetyltransferase